MAEVFTEELRFGPYSSGIMTEQSNGVQRRTIIRNDLFNPASLFAGGAQGAWYDPTDLSNMFQDSAGTIPCALNAPVGRLCDKSGNGNHLVQATAASRPTLRQLGTLYYLDFDGIDDNFASATGNLSNSPKLTVSTGFRLNSAVSCCLFANNASIGPSAGGFRCFVNAALGANSPANAAIYDGVTQTDLFETTPVVPPRQVTNSFLLDYSGATAADEIIIRENGIVQALSVQAAGPCSTINFANSPFIMGQFGGVVFFSGRMFGLIAVGGGVTAGQLTSMENYLALRSGIPF